MKRFFQIWICLNCQCALLPHIFRLDGHNILSEILLDTPDSYRSSFFSGSMTVSYGWMRWMCQRSPTVKRWKRSKKQGLSFGCTCAEDDPFWRLLWKSSCSKGLKVIETWTTYNRTPVTNDLIKAYAITHPQCTLFFYSLTFSVYQEIWNPMRIEF